MAEQGTKEEVKTEKKEVKISIWFIILLIVIILLGTWTFKMVSDVNDMKQQLINQKTEYEAQLQEARNHTDSTISTYNKNLDKVLKALQSALNEDGSTLLKVSSLEGTYPFMVDEQTAELTIAADNVASLKVKENDTENVYEGTYTLTENSIVFTSNDGAKTYTFNLRANVALELVNPAPVVE